MTTVDLAAISASRREERLQMALLLAFAGGYLDAYTWMVHGVMANAQTANLVLLWVYGTAGNWTKAIHFVQPILAFTMGVVAASLLRQHCGERSGPISILVEIVFLIAIGILHNRLPDLAGTLGISFVAALQASAFTKVEGAVYSSVMITGNLRQAVERLFAAMSGSPERHALRRTCIFAGFCIAFGIGAAAGAFATDAIPELTLGVPVIALLTLLLSCEVRAHESR